VVEELYDARSGRVPDEEARAAIEAADFRNRLHRIKTRLSVLKWIGFNLPPLSRLFSRTASILAS
jgi:hypothetical protein